MIWSDAYVTKLFGEISVEIKKRKVIVSSQPRRLPATTNKVFQTAILVGVDKTIGEELAEYSILLEINDTNDVADAVKSAGITKEDFRSKVIFIAGGNVGVALSCYAVICGLSNRFIDVTTENNVILTSKYHKGNKVVDAGKIKTRAEVVQIVDSNEADPVEVSKVLLLEEDSRVVTLAADGSDIGHLTPKEVSELRGSKQVLLQVPSTLEKAFSLLFSVAGVRLIKGFDRFPIILVDGQDLFDLDVLRLRGVSLRKSAQGMSCTVVEEKEPSSRQRKLVAASRVSMEELLIGLGSTQNTKKTLWQCPRVWSHTHGDADASSVVTNNTIRCYVDDSEYIDPLRLVIETCNVTPDEAASLLLGPIGLLAPFKNKILEERENRKKPTDSGKYPA